MNYMLAKFDCSFGLESQLPPPENPEIVFSGRSNVGKSSAINRIFQRKTLARTSATPGKTTTINFFSCPLTPQPGSAVFVDLPGYGYAKRSASERERWAKLINGYFDGDRDVRLVVQLIDARHPASADDRMMLDYLIDRELPFLILLTKVDKLNKTKRAARTAGFAKEIPEWEDLTVIPFSSVTGEGADVLREILDEVTADLPDETL